MRKFHTNTVEIKIYKSKRTMRDAIKRLGYECTYTESMVIPCKVYNFDKNGRSIRLPISSELYTHEKITLPVLVHETLHAATTALRHNKEKLNLSRGITYSEELLAYTQTAILQDILKVFFPKRNSKYNFGNNIKRWAKDSVKNL